MSHIVIDARELRTSTGRYVERLLHYLQQIDRQHLYSVLLKPEDMAGWQPASPNFRKIACPHKEFTFDEQTGLLKQIKSLKPDLVHFAIVQQPVRYKGKKISTMHDLTTVRFRNPAKNPLIFTIKQQVYKWVNKKVAWSSRAIITPSQFVKDDIVAFTGVQPSKITVTYEAADEITAAAEAVPGLEQEQFIMYVGRPTPHKNLPRLIAAYQLLRKTHPKLKLVLAGKKDANYAFIESGIPPEELAGIVFTGFVSEGQLRWLYEHCQAYVFPSLSEGFGLPGLEAMRHGAPVVSSNATCLPEIYGDAALYFDPLIPADIAAKIRDVLDNPPLRQLLINKGQIRVHNFSWLRMAQQTLQLYNLILKKS